MPYSSIYGPFTGAPEVTAAVLSTLQQWILYYLGEVERQDGLGVKSLTPPGGSFPPSGFAYPSSSLAFRPGLDFETWQGEQLPLLIVYATPSGETERSEEGRYQQWYEVQVAAVVQDLEQESGAQFLASRYGKAITALLAQQGGLGNPPLAQKTVLTQPGRTEFVDPTNRRFARSTVIIRTLFDQVVDDFLGPRTPTGDPYAVPQPAPTVQKVDITLTSQGPGTQTSSPTGVTVTDPTAPVVVHE